MCALVENRTNEEFTKANPNKKVPAMDDNGFCLSERWAGLIYFYSIIVNQQYRGFQERVEAKSEVHEVTSRSAVNHDH